MFLIYRSERPQKERLILISPYAALTAIMAALVLGGTLVSMTGFDSALFFGVIQGLPNMLATDMAFLVFIVPVTVGLFIRSWRGSSFADCVMLMLLVAIGLYYLLDAATGIPSQPYRLVPLLTFFAIGTGMMFARAEPEKKQRAVSIVLFVLTLPLVTMIVIGVLYSADTMLLVNRLTRTYG
jgi:hypothetical protein